MNNNKLSWKKLLLFDGFSSLIIIGTSIYILSTLISYGTATTPDSIHYLDVSQNIADGFGLVENTYLLGSEKFKPFTSWPPLYPIVLSLFAEDFLSGPYEAAQFNYISLPISILLMYILLRQFSRPLSALTCSLVFLFSQPVLAVFSYAWSETLFIPLLLFATLISIVCIRLSYTNQTVRIKFFIFLLVIFIVALFYCRYIGIAFAVLLPLTWFLCQNKNKLIKYYFSAGIFYCFFVGLLLARNYKIAGSLGGLHREKSVKNLLDNIFDLWDAVNVQFLFSPKSIFIGFLAVLLASFIKYYSLKKFPKKIPSVDPTNKNIFKISMAAFISYLAALLLLRSIFQFDFIDTRLISLIWPFIIIFLTLAMDMPWGKQNKPQLNLPIFSCAVFLIVLILNQSYSVYRKVLVDWNKYPPRVLSFYSSSKANLNNYTLKVWKDAPNSYEKMFYELRNLKEFDSIITERPHVVQLLSGIKAREFPQGVITNETINLINNSSDKGVIFIKSPEVIDRLYSYYENNKNMLIINRDFYFKYQALLIPLPLPLTN